MNQKLSDYDLKEIARLKAEQNLSNAKLGEMFGVTPPGIHRALKRFRGERAAGPSAEQQRAWRAKRAGVPVPAIAAPSPDDIKKQKRLDFLRYRAAKLSERKEVA